MKRGMGIFLASLLVIAGSLTQWCFAGGDSSVYSSSTVDSNGNQSVTITNRGARNLNRYIQQTQNGCYVYKNYSRLTPKQSSTIAAPETSPRSCSLRAPYAEHDVTYMANSCRVIEPIVIPCSGFGTVDIAPIIISEARRNNIDPILLKTVIKYESGFCATAVSPAGACGLMQLMPGTASVLGVIDVFSPHQNIAGGAQYIRRQLDSFGGNVALALAAYNAGPGAVSEYGGIPPFEETQNYVNMILSDYFSQAKVARRRGAYVADRSDRENRKIDVISTLTRLKGSSSSDGEDKDSSAGGALAQPQASQIIPINTTAAPAAQTLLENRSATQKNLLENNPTVKVPGY
jgi:hypothetical protein